MLLLVPTMLLAPLATGFPSRPSTAGPELVTAQPLSYASFLIDKARDVTVDPATGDVFVCGSVDETFPMPPPASVRVVGNPTGQFVAYAARIAPSASPSLRYLTLFGGGGVGQEAIAVAFDPTTGTVWLTGPTRAADFPTTTGPALGPDGRDTFLLGLDAATGTLRSSTLLGLGASATPRDVAVAGGRAVVVGDGYRGGVPASFSAHGSRGGGNGFAVAVDVASGAILGGAVLGGDVGTDFTAVALDPGVAVYVAGGTLDGATFPQTSDAFTMPSPGASKGRKSSTPTYDAHVVRFDWALTTVGYATRMGGPDALDFFFKAAFRGGRLALVGSTESASLTTPAAQSGDPTYGGNVDGLVAVLDFSAATPAVVMMSYFGGEGWELIRDVALDARGRLHVVGEVSGTGKGRKSDPFPVLDDGTGLLKQSVDWDGFYAVLDPAATGATLVYSTPVGGEGGAEGARAVALRPDGSAAVLLEPALADLPVTATAVYPVQSPGLGSWLGVVGPVL